MQTSYPPNGYRIIGYQTNPQLQQPYTVAGFSPDHWKVQPTNQARELLLRPTDTMYDYSYHSSSKKLERLE